MHVQKLLKISLLRFKRDVWIAKHSYRTVFTIKQMITAKPVHPHRDPITIAAISPETEARC